LEAQEKRPTKYDFNPSIPNRIGPEISYQTRPWMSGVRDDGLIADGYRLHPFWDNKIKDDPSPLITLHLIEAHRLALFKLPVGNHSN
jgi:hypothetical protein